MKLLLNMVDCEQTKFHMKIDAETQKGSITISFKAFLVGKELLKDTCGLKIPVWDRLNKTFTPKHKPQNYFKEIQFRGSPNPRNFDIYSGFNFMNYTITNIL